MAGAASSSTAVDNTDFSLGSQKHVAHVLFLWKVERRCCGGRRVGICGSLEKQHGRMSLVLMEGAGQGGLGKCSAHFTECSCCTYKF